MLSTMHQMEPASNTLTVVKQYLYNETCPLLEHAVCPTDLVSFGSRQFTAKVRE